jgi:uncharacterized phage-associated protein
MPNHDPTGIADLILAKLGPLPHLKLQKLLFYCDAWNLAIRGEPLIGERFEAWVHGPVCRKVWDVQKSSWQDTLTNTVQITEENMPRILAWAGENLSSEEMEVFNDVLEEYGDKTAYHLEKLTHSEAPWIEARVGHDPGDRCTNVIPMDRTRDFYRSLLYGKESL